MCGRYATTRTSVDLSALFEAADETDGALAPDYNLAPTDPAPIVRISTSVGGRVVSAARWGLVPPWAPDLRGAARMINARAETVETSKAYGPSFARRRCLVPADGWYEWLRLGARQRQAYFMTPRDGSVLAFAGLWSVWGRGEDRVLTCSVITTSAVGDLALVHDRMPLALPRDRWVEWLTGKTSEPSRLLVPPSAEFVAEMEIRPVGAAVGDVRNDGPELLTRVPAVPLGAAADGQENSAGLTLF